MNFGGTKPKVLVFFADAVPTEDEIELAASITGNIDVGNRNAAAVQSGEKPEKAHFVAAVSDDVIPEAYADYPRWDKGTAKRVADYQRQERNKARDALQDGLTANNGVEPQWTPPQDGMRPQIIPGSEAKPDLDAIHGKNQPKPAGEKLGGWPGTAPDGVTSRDPNAGGDGGDPATPAPDADANASGAVPGGPAAPAGGPKPAGKAS